MVSYTISKINVHKFSFFPATIRLWNNLPDHIVQLETVGRFRNSVNDYVVLGMMLSIATTQATNNTIARL